MSYDASIDLVNFGEMVSDLDDIKQTWSIILMSTPGSDPLRPTFGSGIFDWIDKPLSDFDGSFLSMIITDLEFWEKRCTIQQVKIRKVEAQIILYISGTFISTKTPIEISINLTQLQQQNNVGSYSNAYNKLQYS